MPQVLMSVSSVYCRMPRSTDLKPQLWKAVSQYHVVGMMNLCSTGNRDVLAFLWRAHQSSLGDGWMERKA